MNKECRTCAEEYHTNHLSISGQCPWCVEKEMFAEFARNAGLLWYPDPSGERYLYSLDGKRCCKKNERVEFIDELWDALVRAKGGDKALMIDQ